MIAVMRQLKQLHNFNALMALLAGINSSAVYRLKHTFSQLGTRGQNQLYVTMQPPTACHVLLALSAVPYACIACVCS